MTVRAFYYFFSYFMVSLSLALVLVPMMKPLSIRLGAVDKGMGRRVHDGVIPRLGGIGIAAAFFLPAAFSLTRGEWGSFEEKMVGVLLGCGIVFLTGLYDDIKGARVRTKLFLETMAALVIYAWGVRITLLSTPFGSHLALGWFGLPVTVFWIIVITNAMNLIDGMDGLAAGTGIAIVGMFFVLATRDIHLELIYAILAGSLLGFLRYNFPPASIFMGDSGSLLIGFFLASISIISSRKAATMATMMIPLVAFSLPLMDMLYAVLRRYYRGVALGKADREHIHHKLLEKGFTKKKALIILYSLNICIMLTVLMFVRRQLNIDFLGLIMLAFIAVAGLRLLGYVEFVPFIRDTLRKHDTGKKRRYYDYVVSRFRRDASRTRSLEDLKVHLTRLLREYNFYTVEVVLHLPHVANPFYKYGSWNGSEGTVNVSFPVKGADSDVLGEVHMRKPMDGDQIAVTPDLIKALSEEIGCTVEGLTKEGAPAQIASTVRGDIDSV